MRGKYSKSVESTMNEMLRRCDTRPSGGFWRNRPSFLYRDATTRFVSGELLAGHVRHRHRRPRFRCRRKTTAWFPPRKEARWTKGPDPNPSSTRILGTDTWTRDSRAFPSIRRDGKPNGIRLPRAPYRRRRASSRRDRGDFRGKIRRSPPPSLHATPFSTRSIRNRFSNRWANATDAPWAENTLVAISRHCSFGDECDRGRVYSTRCDRFTVAYLRETRRGTCPPPPNGSSSFQGLSWLRKSAAGTWQCALMTK